MKSAFMFPIYLARIQNSKREIQKEDITEDRGTWYPREASMVGHNRPERGKTNSW